MSFFKIELQGLGKLEQILDSLSGDKMERIGSEFEATAYDVADGAKQRVPKNLGPLANSITVIQRADKVWEIVVQKHYGPYVEFGTGQQAAAYLGSQDAELREYAQTFYVNGQGRMMPRPFLFPAMMEEKAKLIERIKNILLD